MLSVIYVNILKYNIGSISVINTSISYIYFERPLSCESRVNNEVKMLRLDYSRENVTCLYNNNIISYRP
mgnify:CR=1 FL=1